MLFISARGQSVRNACGLVASIVLLELISFGCFDYLVPSYRFRTDPDLYWDIWIDLRFDPDRASSDARLNEYGYRPDPLENELAPATPVKPEASQHR